MQKFRLALYPIEIHNNYSFGPSGFANDVLCLVNVPTCYDYDIWMCIGHYEEIHVVEDLMRPTGIRA